jgi:hypothetical protein
LHLPTANDRCVTPDDFAKEEQAIGVCEIGVSLKTEMTERYAISPGVAALRFDENQRMLLSSLWQCKAEVEAINGA